MTSTLYRTPPLSRRGWTLLGLALGSLLVALYAISGILLAAMLTGSRLAALIYTVILLVAIIAFVSLLVAFIRVLRRRVKVPIPES